MADGPATGNGKKTARTDRNEKGQFLPGHPGPGRPKGSFGLFERVRRKLEKNPQRCEEIIDRFLERCLDNDRALEHLAARLDGPIPTKIDSENPLASLTAMVVLGDDAPDEDARLRQRGAIASRSNGNSNGNGKH